MSGVLPSPELPLAGAGGVILETVCLTLAALGAHCMSLAGLVNLMVRTLLAPMAFFSLLQLWWPHLGKLIWTQNFRDNYYWEYSTFSLTTAR